MKLFALLAITSSAFGAIFGIDNRISIQPNFPQAELARSTAVAVLSSNVEIVNGRLVLDTNPLSDFVCKEERFSADPSLSYACTGFLVAPDLIATAGHCMVNTGVSEHETDAYCEAFSWLFDYSANSDGITPTTILDPAKHYRCKEVVYAIKEETAPFRDFALVQLERPVLDRKPLKLAAGDVLDNTSLSMIGYPLGAPAKLSPNAKILLNNKSRQSFVTNLDAFEGNSGSPVFNAKQEVVGILIAGTPSNSYYTDAKKGCDVYNRCDENGNNCSLPDLDTSVFPGFQQTGSEVQRISPIVELVKSLGALKP